MRKLNNLLLGTLILSFILTGCDLKQPTNQQSTKVVKSVNQTKPTDNVTVNQFKSNIFEWDKVKDGDIVAGLKFKNNGEGFKQTSFEGILTLSGAFEYKHVEGDADANDPNARDIVIFYPDKESLSKIPNIKDENGSLREFRFELQNYDQFSKYFGKLGNKGTAEIVVDRLDIAFAMKNVNDYAHLVKVNRSTVLNK